MQCWLSSARIPPASQALAASWWGDPAACPLYYPCSLFQPTQSALLSFPSLCFPLLSTAWHNNSLRPNLVPVTLPLGSESWRHHQNPACLGGKRCDRCPWNNSPSPATWVFALIIFAKRRQFCFYSLWFVLCFCFTSVSCSDIDVFLRKSSCASGFLFSFMTLRENICCCCSLTICLQLFL